MWGFFSGNSSGIQVGVDFMPTGVAAVCVLTGKKTCGEIRQSDFLPAVGAAEQSRVLRDWVDQHGLKKAPCVGLIAQHDVQQFQLEKPTVEDSEILQAVSWKIKDLINFDVNAAVVDTFELPPSPKSPVKNINAVVANESVVADYVERIKQSGMELKVIDIHDLVSKNFNSIYDFSNQTIALLQFSDNEGLITIYHHEDLFVFRNIKIGLLGIEAAINDGEELYDNLLLELQRSMDYFESSYGYGLVQKMIVFPQTQGTERMATYLQNYVGYEFDFAQISYQGQPIAPSCFAAYCAALRSV